MTKLCCPECPGKTYDDSHVVCPEHCSVALEPCPVQPESENDAGPAAEAEDTPSSAGERSWDADVCWSCGASPNRENSECSRCCKRLVPPRLVMTVGDGSLTARTIELDRGDSAELGRLGPHATLFKPFPNVSRRHAKVRVDDDGSMWLTPLPTPNGTFYGPELREIPPNVPQRLNPEDMLRFALRAMITVTVYALPKS